MIATINEFKATERAIATATTDFEGGDLGSALIQPQQALSDSIAARAYRRGELGEVEDAMSEPVTTAKLLAGTVVA